jgi:alpha-glucosidase
MERGPSRLVFRRQSGLICAVNFGADPAGLPAGDVLITSGPLDDGRLPADTAAWIRG